MYANIYNANYVKGAIQFGIDDLNTKSQDDGYNIILKLMI